MNAKQDNSGYLTITLSSEEALVLLDWLSRFNEQGHVELFRDQAEEQILFDLEVVLEKNMSESFDRNYDEILMRAQQTIRDKK